MSPIGMPRVDALVGWESLLPAGHPDGDSSLSEQCRTWGEVISVDVPRRPFGGIYSYDVANISGCEENLDALLLIRSVSSLFFYCWK